MTSLAFALLADGRFPAGGHVHSAGVEAAVVDGRIVDITSLEAYLVGRLHTVARTEAALAAATTFRLDDLAAVDAEAEARITVPSLRVASRRLGRQLARAASPCWPSALLVDLVTSFPQGAHQPVALGVVGVSAGLGAADVARLAVHHGVTTPAQAAVRLLGLDPFAVVALAARLAPQAEAVAVEASELAAGPLRDLPATTGPIVDIAACERDGLLFAT